MKWFSCSWCYYTRVHQGYNLLSYSYSSKTTRGGTRRYISILAPILNNITFVLCVTFTYIFSLITYIIKTLKDILNWITDFFIGSNYLLATSSNTNSTNCTNSSSSSNSSNSSNSNSSYSFLSIIKFIDLHLTKNLKAAK